MSVKITMKVLHTIPVGDFFVPILRNGDIPVGLVPGGPDSFVTKEECAEMEEIGIDYLNCDPVFLSPYMMDSKELTKVLCVTYENASPNLYQWLDEDPRVDVIEAGFLPHSEFGRRFLGSS